MKRRWKEEEEGRKRGEVLTPNESSGISYLEHSNRIRSLEDD